MAVKKKEYIVGYDYSTREAREETVNALFLRAKTARTTQESLWRKYNNYYNFCHDALDELKQRFDMPMTAQPEIAATGPTPGIAAYQGAAPENAVPSTINGIETMV